MFAKMQLIVRFFTLPFYQILMCKCSLHKVCGTNMHKLKHNEKNKNDFVRTKPQHVKNQSYVPRVHTKY